MIGRRFDLDVLAGVLELGVAEALDRLEPALDDGLVEVDDGTAGRFAFSHALVSSTLVGRAERGPARRPARPHHRRARVTSGRRPRAVGRGPRLPRRRGTARRHGAEGAHLRPARGGGRRGRPVIRRGRRPASTGVGRGGPPARLPRRRAPGAAAAARHCPARDGRPRRPQRCSSRRLGSPRPRATSTRSPRSSSSLDVDSLWAGYDWNLHDATGGGGGRASAGPARPHRPGPDDADDGARRRADLRRQRPIQPPLRRRPRRWPSRSTTPSCPHASCSSWFWSVSGPSGVRDAGVDRRPPHRPRPRRRAPRPAAAARPPRPGVVGAGARRRRPGAALRAMPPACWPTRCARRPAGPTCSSPRPGSRSSTATSNGLGATPPPCGPALHRVRRYTADSSPASILAVVETESGDTDAALALARSALRHRPTPQPIRWLEAWVLSEGGRLDDARVALAGFDGPLPDDWLQAPADHRSRPRRRTGRRRPLPPPPPARPRRRSPTGSPSSARAGSPSGRWAWPSPRRTSRSATQRPPVLTRSRRWRIAEAMGAVLWIPRARRLLDSLPSA